MSSHIIHIILHILPHSLTTPYHPEPPLRPSSPLVKPWNLQPRYTSYSIDSQHIIFFHCQSVHALQRRHAPKHLELVKSKLCFLLYLSSYRIKIILFLQQRLLPLLPTKKSEKSYTTTRHLFFEQHRIFTQTITPGSMNPHHIHIHTSPGQPISSSPKLTFSYILAPYIHLIQKIEIPAHFSYSFSHRVHFIFHSTQNLQPSPSQQYLLLLDPPATYPKLHCHYILTSNLFISKSHPSSFTTKNMPVILLLLLFTTHKTSTSIQPDLYLIQLTSFSSVQNPPPIQQCPNQKFIAQFYIIKNHQTPHPQTAHSSASPTICFFPINHTHLSNYTSSGIIFTSPEIARPDYTKAPLLTIHPPSPLAPQAYQLNLMTLKQIKYSICISQTTYTRHHKLSSTHLPSLLLSPTHAYLHPPDSPLHNQPTKLRFTPFIPLCTMP